ncbi:phosphatase PAP2 family protein [Cupriavidus necator]|uniref:phosphatase PAP2 family protein n=1 Tax=Cupriavidus necator TaxID=106590 RepID=UPI0014900590|nr:phosphatase PAP2 family protein [Cupriavidus necator]NOV22030.1 phosphatase PAP2 family protein [Cupriavidus necator]
MNAFDSSIIQFLNQFSFRWPVVDHAVLAMTQFYMLRGLPMIALLWWLWFRDGVDKQRDREIVVATVVAAFCALLLGRFLASGLPFRLRPMANPEVGLRFLLAADDGMRTWSSFPSDHAMLWCAVATGVLVASRWLGLLALAYAVLMISMSRVFVGLHYPTDVIAGALLGVLTCLILTRPWSRERIAAPFLFLCERYRGLFHVGMFLLSFGLITNFDEIRTVASSLMKVS